MKLSAIFESWHIGDGNYPPLHKGQLVNLSFEVEPRTIEEARLNSHHSFEHLGNGECRFCGDVIRVYSGEDRDTVVIFEAGDFRFYVMSYEADRYVQGQRYCGEGTLLLDHFYWVEFLSEYENPPNLFYNLEVNRIKKIRTPERFVERQEQGKSFPTRLVPEDYSDSDVEELDTMEEQSFDEEFYIIEFDKHESDRNNIPRTFLS
ncbi:MAG: hypothetical protein MSG64_16030 [Pyrinomonadaceae bacterium MAG19_C2-C3]|nr:hypothetical protein [Pyrinomonadaceae bacterium MAG19_C2-C3]